MHIDTIDSLEAFAKIRGNWDAVYGADPEAQFFLSTTWLSKWLEGETFWFILAAKPDSDASDYVAFLPLRLEVKTRKGSGFHNNLEMVCREFADYTGFVCTPEFEDRALPAFAEHMKGLNWTKLKMPNMSASDGRLKLFTRQFPEEAFEATTRTENVDDQGVDHAIHPYAKLPQCWEDYLTDNLSSNARQKVRRFLRKVDDSDEFRITLANAETLEFDVELLHGFWTTKWGETRPNDLQEILAVNRKMILHCFENGSLFLPVLWMRDRPLGALAIFVDKNKKSLLFWMAGRDETYKGPPAPGIVLHAYSIRHAISNGFTSYDFLRGNEAYKYMFTSDDRRTKFITLRTANGRNLGDKLDARCLDYVFDQAFRCHRAGKIAKAKIAYQQILDVEPDHRKALYALAQLMAADGDHVGATNTLRTFLALEPDAHKAWFLLGVSHAARSEFPEAVKAYRKVIERRPKFIAYKNLGDCLLQLGELGKAVSAFEEALCRQALEEKDGWSGTVEAMAKLPAKKRVRYAQEIANLGDKFRERGGYGFAVFCYRQAIEAKPGLITAQLGLGLALQSQKKIAGLSLSQ